MLGYIYLCIYFYCIINLVSFLLFSGGAFMATAEHIRLPDDCTVGYIVEALLGVSLTRSARFHSHLENLGLVSDVQNQVHTTTQTDTTLITGAASRATV